jgi:hypothetical protein
MRLQYSAWPAAAAKVVVVAFVTWLIAPLGHAEEQCWTDVPRVVGGDVNGAYAALADALQAAAGRLLQE